MFYGDFKHVGSNGKINFIKNHKEYLFSVILRKNHTVMNAKYSLANASKPLVFCASLFGVKSVRYIKNGIVKVKCLEKAYCLVFISSFAALITFVRPASWQDTRPDVPLNILTKTFGLHHTFEVFYSIFIVCFGNSGSYVELFKKLDSIDAHFEISKAVFKRRFILSALLAVIPFIQTSFTFWLRKFHVQNVGAHLTFFLTLLQGSIICFFMIQIYIKCLVLNALLKKKLKTLDSGKEITLRESCFENICNKLSKEPTIIGSINDQHCWYELMQIYDKICDCVDLFNNIYTGQVFIMFNSWLLCTLLIICRSLSPTVKFSGVILSDIFLYTNINIRPLILAKMSELIIEQRNKTMKILLNILTYDDLEYDEYVEQIQTMIDLVETRRLEISANVFTVNILTVLNFSGRIISYTVLMIQYFYMHDSKK